MGKENVRKRLVAEKNRLKTLLEDEGGLDQGAQLQIAGLIQNFSDVCAYFAASYEERDVNPMLTVPLHMPYKKARMKVLAAFRAVYCSTLIRDRGGVLEAASFAEMDKANFRRILRTALQEMKGS